MPRLCTFFILSLHICFAKLHCILMYLLATLIRNTYIHMCNCHLCWPNSRLTEREIFGRVTMNHGIWWLWRIELKNPPNRGKKSISWLHLEVPVNGTAFDALLWWRTDKVTLHRLHWIGTCLVSFVHLGSIHILKCQYLHSLALICCKCFSWQYKVTTVFIGPIPYQMTGTTSTSACKFKCGSINAPGSGTFDNKYRVTKNSLCSTVIF